MAKKLIDELGRTTLSWEEYSKKAKKIWDSMKKGERKWPAIREALGTGYWVPVDRKGNPIGTEKVEFMMKGNPRNPLGFQRSQINPGPGSKGRTGQMDTTIENRKINEQFTDITAEEAAAKWKTENIDNWNKGKKFTSGPYKGSWEIVPENPTMEAINPKSKYFRRYEHKIKIADPFWKTDHGLDYLSGDPENLTYTYPHQYDVKDAGEMTHGKDFIFDVDQYDGDITYTPRKGFKPHDSRFKSFKGHIDETIQTASKIKGVTKGAKLVGKAIPYVGLGIAGAGFTNQVKAANNTGSAANYAKLGLRTIDLGLEVVDTFTMGLSTPVTLAAQAGLMAVEDYIDNGPAKISTIGRTRR
mgnify:CR=1 FL=1|tara:strand:- start:131 stop:1201 length:1071 start_codon:yes stop_codon:yes gene_type:complete